MRVKLLVFLSISALGMAFIEAKQAEIKVNSSKIIEQDLGNDVAGVTGVLKDTLHAAGAAKAALPLENKYLKNPIYIKGLAKVKGSDCTACHQVERKLIGPSYADVAAKYPNTEENVGLLTQKVIGGGIGVWGELPMPAHGGLSEEDTKDMIRYILLLRK
jgi:cytochrome c